MGSKIIQRFDVGARMSEMSVYNGIAHLAGQVAEDASADIAGRPGRCWPPSMPCSSAPEATRPRS
jgi:hypothetical protein